MDHIILNRVVDGLRYNTETSQLIAEIARTGGDWKYERTQLFRTRKGRFFLAGEGGAATRWRRLIPDDRGYVEGDGVLPLSDEEARGLIEKHANHLVDDFFAIEDA